MIIHFTLNGAPQELTVNPGENVQKLLFNMGMHSVRNSDDGFGFAGSDAIIFNGNIVNASLLIAAQLEKADIRTAESLGKWNELSLVQQAMVDVGVVQSGYNDPAAALIITDLLDRIAAPTREEIDDALSGLFSRDAGWQQYYQVIELAVARKNNPQATIDIAPTFRDDLEVIGKHYPKTDAAKMVQAKPCYVEDRVTADACVIKMLRSPHAHALITHLDVSKAEALPGVVHVITHLNCPDIYYTPGGQSAPEPSPLDRRMFGKKMRHVGDRVAAVVAESEEIALEALKLIDVEYEVLKPVMSIDEAMAEDAPVVHDEPVVYVAGAPDTLEDDNSHAAQRGEHMIINFPIGSRPRKNIAASIHGHIGDMDKGFADADVIIERTYNSTQAQQCPTETHICFTRMDGDRLVIHASTQVPWHLRRQVARLVGMKQHKVHVIKERVGGGFGSKQDILLEEVCAWATCVTGRPVLFRYTREEEFIANTSRHVAKVTVKLGAKKDGRLTAVKMDFRANTGPYGNHSLTVPCNGPALSLPLYPCDNVDFQVTTYYSNICPNGAYQGYGAPKGNFAITMALAELAEQLQIDQLEIIERNRVHEGQELKILGAIGEGKAPTSVPSAASCALEEILRQGREMIQWSSPKPQNGDWHIGRGVAIIMQKSGIPDIDQANCMIKLESDGTFIVHSGGADIGTGLDTVVTKLAAEVLHCPPQDVHVISGDTDLVVLMIGLSLIKVGIIDFGGGFAAKSSGTFGNYEHLGVGLLVLIVVIGFNCCRSPLLRMGGIAIGLCVGYIASLCLGMVDFSSMRNLPLITIPHPFKYGFSFSFHQFLVVGTIYLLSVLEAVGDITATAMVSRRPIQGEEYQSRLKGGVLADGLVSVIASAVGSLPLTTFAQNNGVIQMTGVASRYVGRTIAVMLVILGLFPMIGGFFTTIPSAVLGGAMTLMFSMIAIAGIRIIITNGLKRRETLIVATSLGLGLGVSYDPEIFKILPASIYVLVENPICAGGLTAILLNIILPGGYRQENVLPGITSAEEMD
ncbi:molybdopterin-dependent oxidoreductase Mo/Fe-S-binding subunit [Escherichia coli]|nr:molybdopterin-dependent oxidoreductase Mo/Fe-S-binding subunit [Escherichia coli]EHB0066106.1 molybdopterin-dependent oxidoreductase Mo/Fe-S-binding subunit [Escherichia coli]